MYLLGYDIGSSSVKASILEADTGRCIATSFHPGNEAPIISHRPGWAEQDPDMWWENLAKATHDVLKGIDARHIMAIGISYQMHGLVCVGKDHKPLRPAIIWCDSRAVPYGNRAFDEIGHDKCLDHLLNSPGNFTASKLAWVRENEPEVFGSIHRIMLPGDYISMRLSGEISTTAGGLSEGMMWDFKENCPAGFLLDHFGIPRSCIADIVPTFAKQCTVNKEAAAQLGLREGTPICYRAGDQPNNALSLGVLEPGEVAATAGTSGVVYGVSGTLTSDKLSRVNTFAHVNHSKDKTRTGVLLCINGTGILNSWVRHNCVPEGIGYAEMDKLAATMPIGCDGVGILPFGNGAERVLGNSEPGARVYGLNFNRHSWKHLVRAAQEGIAFSMRYGMDIMADMGMEISRIHAGKANMFLSPVFREALSCTSGATIELMDTDGAAGAARGAGIGAGIWKDASEAFSTLNVLGHTEPDNAKVAAYTDSYNKWKEELEKQ